MGLGMVIGQQATIRMQKGDVMRKGKLIARTITSTLPSSSPFPALDLFVLPEADVTYVATNLPVSSVSRISIREDLRSVVAVPAAWTRSGLLRALRPLTTVY